MIRPYQSADKKSVLGIFDANTPQYFHLSERAGLEQYLDTELEDYFVLELDGQIIGSGGLNYQHDKSAAVFSWAMILPSFHSKGHGTRLVAHRLSHLTATVPHYRVQVRTSQHTYRFYEKMGFTLQQVVKHYWAPDMHLYDMVFQKTSDL